MQEWDKDKFIAAAYRLGAERLPSFLAMKRLAAGIAREIVDTSKTAGKAWYRFTDRFYGRNVQGATSQLQELKRPTIHWSAFFFSPFSSFFLHWFSLVFFCDERIAEV